MKYVLFSLTIILGTTSCRNNEVLKAFGTIDQSMNESQVNMEQTVRGLMQKVTDSAIANPDSYASAFNHANEFNSKTENLLAEIRIVKDLIDEQIGDPSDLETMDQDLDQLFFNGKEPSGVGLRLKKALEYYLVTAEDQLYFFPEAEKVAKSNFSTVPVINRNGEKVQWLEYHFKDYPAIASRTKLTLLEQKAYEVQATFLRHLLEKPQF